MQEVEQQEKHKDDTAVRLLRQRRVKIYLRGTCRVKDDELSKIVFRLWHSPAGRDLKETMCFTKNTDVWEN